MSDHADDRTVSVLSASCARHRLGVGDGVAHRRRQAALVGQSTCGQAAALRWRPRPRPAAPGPRAAGGRSRRRAAAVRRGRRNCDRRRRWPKPLACRPVEISSMANPLSAESRARREAHDRTIPLRRGVPTLAVRLSSTSHARELPVADTYQTCRSTGLLWCARDTRVQCDGVHIESVRHAAADDRAC